MLESLKFLLYYFIQLYKVFYKYKKLSGNQQETSPFYKNKTSERQKDRKTERQKDRKTERQKGGGRRILRDYT